MLLPRPLRAPPATFPAVATVPEMAPETALPIAPVIHSVAMVASWVIYEALPLAWSLSFGIFFASEGFLAAGLAVLGLAVLVPDLSDFVDSDAGCWSLGGPKAAILGSRGGSLGGSLGADLTFQAGLILGAEPPEREAVMLMISSWKNISKEIFGITMT